MGLSVYFYSQSLKVSANNGLTFFEKCFDKIVDKIAKGEKSYLDPTTNSYESISNGEVILNRTEIVETVRQRLAKILNEEWSKILVTEEVDKFKNNNGLYNFQFPDKIYENPNVNPRVLKSNVKVLCFNFDLDDLLHDFVTKILE